MGTSDSAELSFATALTRIRRRHPSKDELTSWIDERKKKKQLLPTWRLVANNTSSPGRP